MANIFDYIKNYGDKSFSEKGFNEVDNLIFSSLAYIDYKDILVHKKISVNSCATEYFEHHTKKESRLYCPLSIQIIYFFYAILLQHLMQQ